MSEQRSGTDDTRRRCEGVRKLFMIFDVKTREAHVERSGMEEGWGFELCQDQSLGYESVRISSIRKGSAAARAIPEASKDNVIVGVNGWVVLGESYDTVVATIGESLSTLVITFASETDLLDPEDEDAGKSI